MSEHEQPVNGFIAVPRSFFADCLWEEKRRFSKAEAFLDLLQEAAFTPHRRFVRDKLLPIERGELAASLRYLSARWQWNKDTVATFLKLLEQMGEIRRITRQAESIIILCKYGRYTKRRDTAPDSEQDEQQDEQPPPMRTSSSHTPDKYEEGNNAIKGEGENSLALIISQINAVSPTWTLSVLNDAENSAYHANRRIFDSFADTDWLTLRRFYSVTRLPEGGAYFRPPTRLRFIQEISDIHGHAKRYDLANPPPRPKPQKPTQEQEQGMTPEEIKELFASFDTPKPQSKEEFMEECGPRIEEQPSQPIPALP
ncbi:MAG: hypothetical protein RLZZ505_2285 [Verrucomicrobiota bacterium]